MKLLDLLVKKTNEDGWCWPGKSTFCYQTKPEHGSIAKFFDRNGVKVVDYCWEKCDDASVFNELTKEQYESALAASEGWTEWGGGECPVEDGVMIDVRYRDMQEKTLPANEPINGRDATNQYWHHDDQINDIIAYRLHKPDINSRANDDRLEQDLNECIGQDVDVVNHPSHYTKGSIECIDAIDSATTGKSGIEAVCVANVIKYLWRYEEKGGLESVRKAQWYLNKLISELESK